MAIEKRIPSHPLRYRSQMDRGADRWSSFVPMVHTTRIHLLGDVMMRFWVSEDISVEPGTYGLCFCHGGFV